VRHIVATLTRVTAGFGFGVAAGTLLGAISGYWALARRLLDPTVQALRAIPRSPGCRYSSCGSAFSRPRRLRLIAIGVFSRSISA